MEEAILYKKLSDKKVKCLACSHYCKILENNTGICGVRKNIDGKLNLLVYGKAVAKNIDPIEKKPLFHFLPQTKVFSIGTFGCNFSCDFCQNWDISQTPKTIKEKFSDQNQTIALKNILNESEDLKPKQIIKFVKKNKIPSIAYTYNEPAVFFEYAYATAKLAKKNKIKNIYVSNGYESKENLEKILPYLDAMNIDLKSFKSNFYKKYCKAKLKPVLETIKQAHKKTWLEITTLIIPGKNDSEKELKQIAEFISNLSENIPWHISRFYPNYKMNNLPATPKKTLEKAYKIGKTLGLNHIYLGNIQDLEKTHTYCPNCKKIIIKRQNYSIIKNNIKNNRCGFCNEKIAGVWK